MLKRAVLLVLLLFSAFIINAFLNPIPEGEIVEGGKNSYGTSYSFEQAEWYGLDSRKAYLDLLDKFDFEWIRIPFFWDHPSTHSTNSVQAISGQSSSNFGNIDDLRWAVSEANKRNVNVVIALGAKTPYYPEFHLPENVASQLSPDQNIDSNHAVGAEILEIDRRLVEALSHYENISHWQIENEPFTPNENGWTVDESLIKEEIGVVRNADPIKRPIILSHVGPVVFDLRWKRLLKLLESGDVLGVNAYFKTQGASLFSFSLFGNQISIPWPRGLSWPVQSWGLFSPDFAGIKKEAGKVGVDVWVLEMQAEPYIRDLNDGRKKEFSFDAEDLKKGHNYLSSEKIKTIGFWGSPFWLFREGLGDFSWLNLVGEIVGRK